MGQPAGRTGTFVLSWAQTELDGGPGAPVALLARGATWLWRGEALRVDGPTGILSLGTPGAEDARRRAAAAVRHLLVRAGGAPPRPVPPGTDALPERGFTVTDGQRSWDLLLVETGEARAPLVVSAGSPPPRETDLWVVSADLGPATRPVRPGGIVCFTPGTRILTETGLAPVEALRPGDRIQTRDNGAQELLWIGTRRLTGARMHALPHLAPVRFAPGSLDRGVPDAGLLVSPDHRVLLRGARARALWGESEVLVAARDLVDTAGIRFERGLRDVLYIHLMLPCHEIVFANGVETDSFHPGMIDLGAMPRAERARLRAAMPVSDAAAYGPPVRRLLSRPDAALLRAA
ncbi:Hint domain-containing protein [Wenxinia saemankumensis]|uniref:Hint domain-containing protein n=1 Tax=Wenxinia saemankumensis TaxID=1447782 RepID=A0A1M6BTQ8_9RHOB|nr:Hint domain-containing protein [Wenxinia saemankumensis]SHI51934.1 Hint domain-containing protein [Wenxinia saemankumensis]